MQVQPEVEERYRAPRSAWAVLSLVALLGVGLAYTGGDPSVLHDDFSGSRMDWLEASDASGSLAQRDGAYHITVLDEGALETYAEFPDVRSLAFDADATMAAGEGGLAVMCLSSVEPLEGSADVYDVNVDHYAFFLSFEDKGYAIFRTGTSEPLAAVRDERLASRSGPRHITARCYGSADGSLVTFGLTVDGREVIEAVDGTGVEKFVGVGLAVFSAGGTAEATFDNVRVVKTS